MVSLETNYSIIAMEYQGYNSYEGSPSPEAIQADAERLIDFLKKNKFTSDELIIFGRSIGCAVTLSITHKYQVYCSVMLSPFLSLKEIVN